MESVFISSTSEDLKEYRQVAIDTCIKLGLFPIAMEHFQAMDTDATGGSKNKLSQASLYVGIFAHRYGYIPENTSTSITEVEYEYAKELGIPRLLFVVDPAYLWPPKFVEKGVGAEKLGEFKKKVMKESIVNFFRSPEDLQAKLALSLIYKISIHTDFEAINKQEVTEYRKFGQIVIKPGFGLPSSNTEYQGDIYVSLPKQDIYRDVFVNYLQPMASNLYLEAKRFEDLPKHESGLGVSSMWSAIFNSRLLIADCTSQDPTVFYELGIARTIGKPILLIAQNASDVPSNFRHFRHIVYEYSSSGLNQLQSQVKEAVTQIVID